MRLWRGLGLGGRLTVALGAVAVVSVALATVLATSGLESRLDQYARDRLEAAAGHSADVAAGYYARRPGWTEGAVVQLDHLAEMNGYRLVVSGQSGRPLEPARALGSPQASAPVVVGGEEVGTVTVAPAAGEILAGEDRELHERLDRLHLLAGGLALAIGLVVAALLAPALARPLRRLTAAARRIERGELDTRVAAEGAPETRELARAFNRLAETLEHEERIRRDVSADVAHELRTPLAGIVSRIEAAQDGLLDRRENLDAMHTEALRLTRLVEDLGKLADAQQPALTLRKEAIELSAIVAERAGVYRDQLAAKGISLEQRLEPAAVVGDAGRIGQIVDNLLSNALRYTDAGGTVSVAVARRDADAVIEVADTGVGIAGDQLPYIFERFWRGEPSRARRTGGAGIGLAIVRELVRAHDGRIDVESKPGEGSCFRVTLPLARTGSASAIESV